MSDTTESAAPAQASLSDLRMPELQALATRLGISGLSKMRKPELVEAIRERRRANGQRPRTEGVSQPTLAAETTTPAAPAAEPTEDRGSGRRARGGSRQRTQGESREQAEDQPSEDQPGESRQQGDQQSGRQQGGRRQGGRQQGGRQQSGRQQPEAQRPEPEQQRDGARGRQDDQSEEKMASLDDIIHFPEPADRGPREEPTRGGRRATRPQAAPEQNRDTGPDDEGDGDDDRQGRRRRGRDRYRDRKRRQTTREGGSDDEVEILEDDVLIPVAGILDVLENYAFVRTSGYLPGPSDVYVSLGQVKKAGLRRGDAITGAVRQPREGESQRQKFNALVRLDSVNGAGVEDASARPDFADLTPIHPDERLRLETGARALTGRVIDLVAPIGKGQRSVVLADRRAGSTATLQQVATAVTTNHPEIHLMVVLVDARPEEVTDWQRTAAGEVIASTFDRPAVDHTTIAELAIERAKRLVELGQDVVIVLDSLTRLGRAYNLAAPPSGRMLPGGVDAAALFPPKRFVGAARNIENGGSLTIVATELADTGSETDAVIAEELAGTSSSQLRLRRELAEVELFPAVDPNASGTQYLDRLLTPDEVAVHGKLRRTYADLEPRAALEALLTKVRQSGSNAELLLALSRQA